MDIFRAERIAQGRMSQAHSDEWDKKFTLVGPTGSLRCEWLDPYFGMFTIEGHEGFVRTKDVPPYVECEMSEDAEHTADQH